MTTDEKLADHFIKYAGIAAVCVDAAGAIGAVDQVGIEAPPNGLLLCCASGKQHVILAKALTRIGSEAGQAAALMALRSAASDNAIGLTPHRAVVQRAFAAVQAVNGRIDDLQSTGGMKELNAEFKAARQAGTVTRYSDFLFAKKLVMLEEIAREGSRAMMRLAYLAWR